MNALELKREYEAKLDELWQKRLDKIEADVAAYRQHLLDTDESYCEEARKYQAIIDEIDKVIAEEAELKKKLDMIEAGKLMVEEPVVRMSPMVMMDEDGKVPEEVEYACESASSIPVEEPIIEEPVIEEVKTEEPAPEIKPTELRRPGMASIFRR